ncbi:hypothetical protein Dsin_023787 [Dipteronia sinensis]|uniref:Purple acid phosphatase n=1 Tax=Dipteronia sinensis TaxID=43782 RepID=A0AAE0A4U8_9ROSI|nr:hypothetical protein Dsin_023787 [Dipteronia sinensis]
MACFSDYLRLVVLVCMLVCSFAHLQRFEHPAKADGTLSFLVVGDWGRNGSFNQSQVALQMGRIGEKLDIDLVVSTGDNFYDNGLKGINDPTFEKSFTKVYTAKSLQKQWYSVLGNHDYRGDVEAQLSLVLRKIDSRWLCMRSFIVNADKDHTYNWQGLPSRKTYINNILKDLDLALRESSAKWKIVIGHHAIRSAGYHGDTPELIHHLLPILKANNVDLYMNGHDHCLGHVTRQDSPIQFLTSGAGSKAWRGYVNSNYGNALKFFHDGQGFVSVELSQTDARIVFYDVFGEVLHKLSLSKELHSAM